MAFNNPANKCNMTGYIVGDINQVNEYAIEFLLRVKRKGKPGEKVYFDTFTIYVSNTNTVAFCKTQLRANLPIQVKGEIRIWKDNSIKICCDEIILKS